MDSRVKEKHCNARAQQGVIASEQALYVIARSAETKQSPTNPARHREQALHVIARSKATKQSHDYPTPIKSAQYNTFAEDLTQKKNNSP